MSMTNVNVEDKSLEACGLVNMGNTCYLNATLHCLHTVAELRCALREYARQHVTSIEPDHELTVALHGLFTELDTSVEAVKPTKVWTALRSENPEFQKKDHDTFLQQDAEECWTTIVNALYKTLKFEIAKLFRIELRSRVYCPITREESYDQECSFMLKCHMTEKVNELLEGLKLGFQTELEKTSPSLGQSALHQKDSKIIKLPQYLSIQFLRYLWNPECKQTEKIKKRVDFPIVLDVTGLCCDELKASLESTGQDSKFGGLYDLVAVLTHDGMTTKSGHYFAWVRDHAGTWVEMNDRFATAKKEDDLAALSGGGSGQMAYLCIYKARHNENQSKDNVKIPEKSQSNVADSDDIIPKVVQKVKDAILQDEDFICIYKAIHNDCQFEVNVDRIIPKMVQKVKDVIPQDEDFICIYKARHNDYKSEVNVDRIIPKVVQKVKDVILQDEDFICIYKAQHNDYQSEINVDHIIPKVVQKVKDAILQDEDFIRQVHTPYNQTNNYYNQTYNYFKDSTSTSDVTAFLGFYILGVMAFLGILYAVIPEGFIERHMIVFSIDILALLIGFTCGNALVLIYLTNGGSRPKSLLWVINMLSMVCGFSTYSSLALWSIEVLVKPFFGRLVCRIFFLGAPLIWMIYWFYKRMEKEHKERSDKSV